MELKESVKIEIKVDIHHLKHLKFEEHNGEQIVTLVDKTGYEILKGYGKTIEEAINDLHHNLL